jgi:protein-glutamine gamma-glutamyltransferase
MKLSTKPVPPAIDTLVPPLGARIAVLTAAISGLLALFSTALGTAPHAVVFAVVSAVVVAAAGWAPVGWPSPGGLVVRRTIAFTLLAITLALCLINLVRLNPGDVADFAGAFSGFLGRLLISVLLAQLFITDRMRDLRVALLLAVGMFVLAVANGPGAVMVVFLLIGWPAVVIALAFEHAATEQSSASAVARPTALARTAPLAPAGPGAPVVAWGRVGRFAAISAVVAVLVVLVVPHPPGVRPRQDGGVAGASGAGDDSAALPRSSASYTSGSLDMRARGTLSKSPVADVPLDSPQLWRGAALDVYDGITWRAHPGSTFGSPVPGGPHFDLPVSDTTFGRGAERRDVVRRRPALQGVLLAPGQPTAVDVPGQVLSLAGGFFVSNGPGLGFPDSYTVTSTSTDLPSAELVGTPVAVPLGQAVPGDALELPVTVPERVRLLGQQITRSATNRDQATHAVETYLRGHATYNLDSPVPPRGEDAVDHFLFVAHTGFCEQFAAAEVVLLRSAGVPARLATGFVGGEPAGDHRTLIGSDAHAWVEVWYPGIGWAASDPTAGARLAETGLHARVSAWLHHAAGRLILAGAVLALAALVALLGWWLRRRARRAVGAGGRPPARPLPPVLAAFERLQRVLDDLGVPRAPAESVSELARRPALRDAVGALAVVERTSYGARPPVGVEADEAVRTLDELAVRLQAEKLASDR